MLSKSQKALYRSEIFRHLDGIAIISTAYSLKKRGLLDYLLEEQENSLQQLSEKFSANKGYLNVGLRALASQGWLDYSTQNGEVQLKVNHRSPTAFNYISIFESANHLLQFSEKFHPRKFEREPFQVLEKLYTQYHNRFQLPTPKNDLECEIQDQLLKQIEGLLVGPTIVLLGMGGMFHKYFMEASFSPAEFHEDPASFEKILQFLASLGWFEVSNGKPPTFRFSPKGLFFAQRAAAYGVTVSYLPMLRKADELMFGNPHVLQSKPGEKEKHVDREMNVWGSGGAHSAYFKKMDRLIIDIFNQPINQQPKGILDMGCGNGAFLIHLFDVIEKQTERGKVLDEHPLFLVGADFNGAALKVTRANLIQADIWAKVIWGDISDPEALAKTLDEDYNIQLSDLLNVRTFLDHNRIWSAPQNSAEKIYDSTGAFASKGLYLRPQEVESNLAEHFEKWKPYVAKNGLLLVELHTIDPQLSAESLGQTAVTAYDLTHGFSDQYILELPVFLAVAESVGLVPDKTFSHRFPDSALATISINFLKGG